MNDPLAPTVTRWRLQIEAAAREHGVDPDLLQAMVAVESGGNERAVSPSDARGLCQIIPRWHQPLAERAATRFGLAVGDVWFDPAANLWMGAAHLAWCISSCGDPLKGIARYHSGQCEPPPDFVDGGGTPTTFHVTKVKAALERLREAPSEYAEPHRPEFMHELTDSWELGYEDRELSGVVLFRCTRIFTAQAPTAVHKYADRSAPKLRADLNPGDTIRAEYWFVHGDEAWAMTWDGERIPLRDCTPRVVIEAIHP